VAGSLSVWLIVTAEDAEDAEETQRIKQELSTGCLIAVLCVLCGEAQARWSEILNWAWALAGVGAGL
jgi:hypothetical protein